MHHVSITTCLIALCLTLLSFQSESLAGFTIVQKEQHRIVMQWHLDRYTVDTASHGATAHSFIQTSDCDILMQTSNGTVLPARSIALGIADEGALRISLRADRIHTRTLKYPPERTQDAETGHTSESVEEAGRAIASGSSQWHSGIEYSRIRGQRIAKFALQPFRHLPGTQRLMVLKHATVTITLPRAASRTPGNATRYPASVERLLKGLLLNYTEARQWRNDPAPSLAKRTARHSLPVKDMITFTVGDGNSGYRETTTEENGIYKFDHAFIRSFYPDNVVHMDRVALYAARRGEMDRHAPAPDSIPSHSIQIPLYPYDADGDNILDTEDFFLAYCSGASGWYYNESDSVFMFELDRYNNARTYWLGIDISSDPARIRTKSALDPFTGARTVSSTPHYTMLKKSVSLPSRRSFGSVDRIWQSISQNATMNITLPDITEEAEGEVFLYPDASHFNISAMYGADTLSTISTLMRPPPVSSPVSPTEWFRIPFLMNDINTLRLRNQSGNPAEVYSVTLQYNRTLTMKSDTQFSFFSVPESRIVRYSLDISGHDVDSLLLFKIDNSQQHTTLLDSSSLQYTESTVSWYDSGGQGIRYIALKKGACRTPRAGTHIARLQDSTLAVSHDEYIIRNLRTNTHQSDYCIITHRRFLSAATRLAHHKKTSAKFSNPCVVMTGDIYRQFSGGNIYPAAIRNFLSWAVHHWAVQPEYVLLLGNGNYDPKQTMSNEKTFIPAYHYHGRCSDNFFACVNKGETHNSSPDLFLGRITCSNAEEAMNAVNKITQLENPDSLQTVSAQAWRNNALLVADDDMQSTSIDHTSPAHYLSSERLGQQFYKQHPWINLSKAYLFEYPWNDIMEKPDAGQAIINAFNRGVAYVNYFGHGGPTMWSDEHVLTTLDLNRLNNKGKYPLVTSFSCKVGLFDKPDHESLTGALVNLADAGAGVGIASARDAYASSNEDLSLLFYSALFDTSGNYSAGAAYSHAVEKKISSLNTETYIYFGDPSLSFTSYSYSADLEFTNADGNRITLDTVRALQRFSVRGRIRPRNTSTESFDGSQSPSYIQVRISNPPRTAGRKDGGTNQSIRYTLPGQAVFSAQTEIHNDSFSIPVSIPKNVVYDVAGAKLTAFAWDAQRETYAAGFREDILFHGTATSQVNDTAGPTITLRPLYYNTNRNMDGALEDNITASLPFQLEVTVSDPNGIDLSGTGPGEGVQIEIPGLLGRQNINGKLQLSNDDYNTAEGVIGFDKNQTEPGTYALNAHASDLLGNATHKRSTLEIVPNDTLRITRVLNYPNPMRLDATTRFFIYTSSPSTQWAETYNYSYSISVYTLTGKRVWHATRDRVPIVWDGKDRFGNKLAPDVYLYKVKVTDKTTSQIEPRTKESTLHKLVIVPPKTNYP